MARPDPHDELDDHAAPPGSLCGVHPERSAVATCPKCGTYACFECWHIGIGLCHACVRRDPSTAAPPIPWEDAALGPLARFLRTLTSALHPTLSAPAFARSELSRPALFGALTLPPLAALAGVIPFTHTLGFGQGWSVERIGAPSSAAIASDVLHAAGIGVLSSTLLWLGVALPYTSLLRAYGERGAARHGLRMLLYRGWLLTLYPGQLLVMPALLSIPEMSVRAMELSFAAVTIVLGLFPLLLFFMALSRTARIAAGVGPIASFLVSMVPVVFGGLAWSLATQLMLHAGWFPAMGE